MRLRYLKITGLPPLEDVEIDFQHESLLGRQCSIRFVVGVNGSGKSRLLRALTEVFVQLERASELDLPFPITLAYDIGVGDNAHSVYIHYPGRRDGSNFAILDDVLSDETDWTNLDLSHLSESQLYSDGDLPGTSAIIANIPRALIAYTSGNSSLWQSMFNFTPSDLEILLEEETEERPKGWSLQDERLHLAREVSELPPEEIDFIEASAPRSQVGFLVKNDNLKLAVLAVTLLETISDLEELSTTDEKTAFATKMNESKQLKQVIPGLRGLLNEVDWLWPLTIGLEIDFDPSARNFKRNQTTIRKLYQAATTVIKQPEPGITRLLSFDLQRTITDEEGTSSENFATTARKLAEALAGDEVFTAFDLYRNLYQLHQQGILGKIQIAVQKTNLDDVLMYDWLSDGEQEFIGRMSLFHLLKDQDDALIILDEPETHFNDVWKRRIVDIIDDSLRQNVSEVVISTHSSIALTDVFETEITLLRKDSTDGTIAVVRQPVKTFGALPSEIMTNLFEAPDVVGQRATEFLDLILMAISYPDDVVAIWNLESSDELSDNPALDRLYDHLVELPHDYGDEQVAKKRLITTLKSLREPFQKSNDSEETSLAQVIKHLQDRLGEGYYEFEFRRRLRALQSD